MNIKYIAILAAIAVTLVASIAISTDSVFAIENSQVRSQDCGSESEPSNSGCQNVASQIQGNEHAVSLSSEQTFGDVEDKNMPAAAPASQQSIEPSIVLPH
jgi:hypothetical protein